MKKQLIEKMFNAKNIKKGLQIGVLGTALAANTMMFTNCTHDNGCSNGHYEGCPHWEKENEVDVKTATLGNGNYTMTCFMVETQTGDVENEVNNNLTEAESYIKGLVNGFSESLNDRPDTKAHFDNFINQVNNIDFVNQINGYGFDLNILKLQNACRPVINEIKNNINDPIDQRRFVCYYNVLGNKVYEYGCDTSFGGTYGKNNTQENYDFNKSLAITEWTDLYGKAADFNADIENGCTNVTNGMDNLIEQAAHNMGNGIEADDLRKVVNLSFNINSLDSMHDRYSSVQIYDKHRTCNPIENDPILSY